MAVGGGARSGRREYAAITGGAWPARHDAAAVGRLRRWLFDTMEREQPGRIYGLPERSVYEGLDADVAALLGRTDEGDAASGRPAGADKGKGRATGEAMDIDR